jgi:hypothetical protein
MHGRKALMSTSSKGIKLCKLLKSQQLSVDQKIASGLALLVLFDSGEVDCEEIQYWGPESTGIGINQPFHTLI